MLNQVHVEPRAHEPPEIRPLSKAKLHNQVSIRWFIAGKETRANSRAYLVGVYEGRFFRIEKAEILHFEAGLEVQDLERVGYHNITNLLGRLSMLVAQLGQAPLGFTPGSYPDESWVFRVVRFVDRSNLLGVFKRAIPNNVVPNIPAARM